MKKILVIGGAGYVGCRLIPELLNHGHQVTVYDLFIYGNNLPKNEKNLNIVKGDVRDINKLSKSINKHNVIIHLACISNDPSFELDPKLGKEINLDCFEPLVIECKKNGVEHFIYASSSSVYGVKDLKEVTESASLEPLTDYSKFKVKCEEILLSHTNSNFFGTVVRPATVCGYSPRQRLDLVVNILTNFAYFKKKIKIFGGFQLRPNIHISDMVNSYLCIINSERSKVKDQIFNVGFENHSVQKLAELVAANIDDKIDLEYLDSNDNRSYHIDSKKISSTLNFKPRKNINEAIKDLIKAFQKKNLYNTFDNVEYFNIKKMQKINLR